MAGQSGLTAHDASMVASSSGYVDELTKREKYEREKAAAVEERRAMETATEAAGATTAAAGAAVTAGVAQGLAKKAQDQVEKKVEEGLKAH